MTALCYIALGSNLDNPQQQIERAVAAIEALAHCHISAQSPRYQTAPIGPGNQPDYINAVIALETGLQPTELLDALQAIENAQGRVRQQRWGARTLDLDILLYDQQVINTDRLTVPHPELGKRSFVLYPLADICPELVLPNGNPLKQLLENCPPDGMVQLSEHS